MTTRKQKAAELAAAAAAVGDIPAVPEIIDPPSGQQDGDGGPPTPASAYHFYLIPLDAAHRPIMDDKGLPEHIEVCCDPGVGASDIEKLTQIANSLAVLAAFAAGGMGVGPEIIEQLKAQRNRPDAARDPEFRGRLDG